MKQDGWLTNIYYHKLCIWISGNDRFIVKSSFKKNQNRNYKTIKLNESNSKKIIRFIDKNQIPSKYFQLTRTCFQKTTWKALLKIPRGKTISYKELAKTIKKPNAIRAVANTCGTNPLPLFIPCHRVIASNGKIGGFSAGVEIKRKLLKNEHVNL